MNRLAVKLVAVLDAKLRRQLRIRIAIHRNRPSALAVTQLGRPFLDLIGAVGLEEDLNHIGQTRRAGGVVMSVLETKRTFRFQQEMQRDVLAPGIG